jgi:hypothetical protein
MSQTSTTTQPRAAVPQNPLRDEILKALKQSDRLTPSELHRRMSGRYRLMDIESELIAMDLDGVVINDLVPQSRITQKGRKARAKAFFTTKDTKEHEGPAPHA